MVIIDLENNWLKYEEVGDDKYYGYAQKADTKSSDKKWAIRKVEGAVTGNTQSVIWNNDKKLDFSAIWDNKTEHFSTLGSSPSFADTANPTYSLIQKTSPVEKTTIVYSWTERNGADRYYIKITDENNILYNYLGKPYQNYFISDKYTIIDNKTSFKFKGQPNKTYSIVVKAVNTVDSESYTDTIVT